MCPCPESNGSEFPHCLWPTCKVLDTRAILLPQHVAITVFSLIYMVNKFRTTSQDPVLRMAETYEVEMKRILFFSPIALGGRCVCSCKAHCCVIHGSDTFILFMRLSTSIFFCSKTDEPSVRGSCFSTASRTGPASRWLRKSLLQIYDSSWFSASRVL